MGELGRMFEIVWSRRDENTHTKMQQPMAGLWREDLCKSGACYGASTMHHIAL